MLQLAQTLVIDPGQEKVLLVLHKQGEFEGLYTGLIGYVNDDESPESAARRIADELCSITLVKLQLRARFIMQVENDENAEEFEYYCDDYSGEAGETETVSARWFHFDEIPYQRMPPDDEIWYPPFLAGAFLKGNFSFNRDMSRITSHTLKELQSL